MKKTSISAPLLIALLICTSAISLMGFSLLSSHAAALPQTGDHAYTVVFDGSIDELSDKVTAKLNKGWKAEGGVAIMTAPGSSARYFYQAMSK